MSIMFEIYYRAPRDVAKEEKISREVAHFKGKLTDIDEPSTHSEAICLTYEFLDRENAQKAADVIRSIGEHVEGPCDYGPD